jgi:hypothetical protein
MMKAAIAWPIPIRAKVAPLLRMTKNIDFACGLSG